MSGLARNYQQCPELTIPVGAESFLCDGSTCAVKCEPGYYPGMGNPRTHCRWNSKTDNIEWNREPAGCVTCEVPVFNDRYIDAFCYTDATSDISQQMCDIRKRLLASHSVH